jgi:prolyl-tRNA synthetase
VRVSNILLPSLKEIPAEAVIASHQLMLRAGLIRKMSAGVYSYLPLGLRALRKVENVVRQEMDLAGAQEFALPLILTREIWEESGRYAVMGDLMMKVRDRAGKDFVLAPTAEEGFVSIIRDELKSWRQLPFTVYQIGKKFRDEIRPRFGVMRGREFLMKDAYSFDRDQEDLANSYDAMRRAYLRIFRRVGLEVIGVAADSGAMGGSGSEEFMVPSAVGENEIVVCHACNRAANVETARCADDAAAGDADTPIAESVGTPAAGSAAAPREAAAPLAKVATPDVRTIEELCAFFSCSPKIFLKSLIYAYTDKDGKRCFALAVIRGDLEVNEVKLAGCLGTSEVALASDAEVERVSGAPTGFAGPVGISGVPIIADLSVRALPAGITGANGRDMHYTGVAHGRDWTATNWADIRTVREGDACEICGKPLALFRGIEVGHIFKLGDKYTKAFGVFYQSESGENRVPIMGCYGIGVDRTLASVIEQHHDADGIIWPAAIAPFDVMIVPINWAHEPTRAAALRLAEELEALGLEVLLDDRDARAGFKFKDADLFGVPLRVTIGEKTLADAEAEWRRRHDKEGGRVPLASAAAFIREEHQRLLADGQ